MTLISPHFTRLTTCCRLAFAHASKSRCPGCCEMQRTFECPDNTSESPERFSQVTVVCTLGGCAGGRGPNIHGQARHAKCTSAARLQRGQTKDKSGETNQLLSSAEESSKWTSNRKGHDWSESSTGLSLSPNLQPCCKLNREEGQENVFDHVPRELLWEVGFKPNDHCVEEN